MSLSCHTLSSVPIPLEPDIAAANACAPDTDTTFDFLRYEPFPQLIACLLQAEARIRGSFGHVDATPSRSEVQTVLNIDRLPEVRDAYDA